MIFNKNKQSTVGDDNHLEFNVETLEQRQMMSSVSVFAAGVTNQEAIELRIDDVVVETWQNVGGDAYGGELTELSYYSDQPIDASQVRIQFVNDLYDPANNVDRNVRVDKIVIDGVEFQTEDPSVFSTGTWKPEDGISAGFRQDEFLHTNGYFQYANDSTGGYDGSIINIRAFGDTGEETLNLEINGERVSSWQVGTSQTSYQYQAEGTVTADQVRIVFENDAYDPAAGYDRNLNVDSITIDGNTIETESGQVFSTGTWKSDDGIAPGFRNSQVLHGNGYFQFGFGSLNEVSQLDGSGNNIDNPEWGSTFEHFLRKAPAAYTDGLNTPSLADNPNARYISNAVSAQSESVENERFISSAWFQWGQFLDHEITRAFTLDHDAPSEPFEIAEGFGFTRSIYDPATGIDSARQQYNHVTPFIDGSVVYGVDADRSSTLRAHVGGRLDSSSSASGDLLPFNTQGLPNEGPPSTEFFAAGDVRSNENIALTAMQTLWMREHNRIATEIAETEFSDRDLSDAAVDEEIFQRARQIVTGLIQNITYNEFLPSTLGFNAISTYKGYDSTINAQISNEFTTAIYRIGHTTLPNELLIGTDGDSISLVQAFMNPGFVVENGIEGIFEGIVTQKMQEVDSLVVDSVRDLLNVGPGGLDLVARNIQRGRDHGMPDYNTIRTSIGLEAATSFHDVISDVELANKFTELYGSPDNADAWIVAISEDHVPGSMVGETIYAYMVDQFTRIRDGDRFYFENQLDQELVAEIKATRLSDVIRRNTNAEVHAEVFWTPDTLVFRNGLDNEWVIRDFGDNGGVEVVFFGEIGVRDPDNRTETAPVQRDTLVNAVIVAGINEGSDGFFIPNALVAVPQAELGIDEFVITADIEFFEGYGLGGNDRWVIESDIEHVFASGDDGTDVLAVRSNVDGGIISLTGGAGYDEITVLAPWQNTIHVDGGADNDSIYVFTDCNSTLTVRGKDVPVVVTSGYEKHAPRVSSVNWSTDVIDVDRKNHFDLLSESQWYASSRHGWAHTLDQRFNQEFDEYVYLPNDLDIRFFWSAT